MAKKDERLNFHKIRTYPIRERENKVKIAEFSTGIPKKGLTFKEYLEGLPDILVGKDFRTVAKSIVTARKLNKPVIFCLGAHVIKCGLTPVIISLMEKNFVTAVAINGAGSIHDFEIAFIGETSEDVSAGLADGTFGMAEETGRLMNETLAQGVKQGLGAGTSLGERIIKDDFSYREYSILAKGIELGIPVTVHIAVGTDVIHQHPSADGAVLGEASFIDFQTFCMCVKDLGKNGVIVNFGSAAVLPEVFLKALTIARNLGYGVENFVTVDFDMVRNYRPYTNVVKRPAGLGSKGYSIIGHHELMIPMLAQAVIEYAESNI